MSIVHAVFWGSLLACGLALTVLYGYSWRTVAKALAEAKQEGPEAASDELDRLTMDVAGPMFEEERTGGEPGRAEDGVGRALALPFPASGQHGEPAEE